eukprot:COSAG02_NODE_21861_length_772_cov_1.309064_1_plen_119_part_10
MLKWPHWLCRALCKREILYRVAAQTRFVRCNDRLRNRRVRGSEMRRGLHADEGALAHVNAVKREHTLVQGLHAARADDDLPHRILQPRMPRFRHGMRRARTSTPSTSMRHAGPWDTDKL